MTASEHKGFRKRLLPLAGVVFLVGLILYMSLWALTAKGRSACPFKVPSSTLSTGRTFSSFVNRGDCIRLGKAVTAADRQQGLSGKTFMPPDEGLLFVFEPPQQACMWMKDMRFSLDMIWLNSSSTITHIERNIKPESYPNSYCGASPAAYVIELNEGTADAAKLKVGDQLKL